MEKSNEKTYYQYLGEKLKNEGKSNAEIVKILRKERVKKNNFMSKSEYRKEWENFGKKRDLRESRNAIRKYDPTYISLTTEKRKNYKIKTEYTTYKRNDRIDWRQDPTGKTTITEFNPVTEKFTENQIKSTENFKKDFLRKANNERKRYRQNGKEIDLSRVTVNFENENKSLLNLFDERLKETNKTRKAKLTKTINDAFSEMKKIKAKQIRETKREIIRFSVERLKKGEIGSALEGSYSITTQDSEGNIFGWETQGSSPLSLYSVREIEINGKIKQNEHEIQLEQQGVDLSTPESQRVLEIFYNYV